MENIDMKKTLTIAGSDCSGGAGIQADIKTIVTNGVYAMSVITAITAQNTVGITGIEEVSADILAKQIDAVFTDIVPDSVKIGMLSSKAVIDIIAEKLSLYNAKNIVLDTVMVSTSGRRLLEEDAINSLKNKLLPIADLITPNIGEAELLSGMEIKNHYDMEKSAKIINQKYGCSVLCKGGHSVSDADDLLYHDGQFYWYRSQRVDNDNTHGTGCTLSSAIASNLAKGYSMCDSVKLAKDYIYDAISSRLNLGRGNGPLDHTFSITGKYR